MEHTDNTNVTRKDFMASSLKTAAASTVFLLTGLGFVKSVFADAVKPVVARTRGVYAQDAKMKLRKSQDNPMVKQLYADFLHEPNSHEAHHLLHTEYTDRSAKIKAAQAKGIKVSL
jgi:ferredoxin hydrogenase small subunit